jgi:hypothetical protein
MYVNFIHSVFIIFFSLYFFYVSLSTLFNFGRWFWFIRCGWRNFSMPFSFRETICRLVRNWFEFISLIFFLFFFCTCQLLVTRPIVIFQCWAAWWITCWRMRSRSSLTRRRVEWCRRLSFSDFSSMLERSDHETILFYLLVRLLHRRTILEWKNRPIATRPRYCWSEKVLVSHWLLLLLLLLLLFLVFFESLLLLFSCVMF